MDDSKTLYCGNLSSRVTEELLYELFLQAGPLEDIVLPKDSSGEQKSFAFIVFKHQCSVEYAIRIFQHTALFERKLDLKPRERGPPSQRQPANNFPISPSFQNHGYLNPLPLTPPFFQSFPPPFLQQQPLPPSAMIPTPYLSEMQQPDSYREQRRCNLRRSFQEDGSYQDDDRRFTDQRDFRREDRHYKPYNSDSQHRKTNNYHNYHSHHRHNHYDEKRRTDYRERTDHAHDELRRNGYRDRSNYRHWQ